ncbi:MAG: dihydroorotate dehydrogenase electron transfer subunit [Clostridiales Family XIII bacterium]|jgi:dihydroorotate dehydrogenase electron transfer subunit|nr:dihydroorotate dehydrogenase electron transfer subunit [Clostridiales Family XIII bacterium]
MKQSVSIIENTVISAQDAGHDPDVRLLPGSGYAKAKICRMTLYAPETSGRAAPGQFINVYLNNESKLLPRPVGISDAGGDKLTIVYAVAGAGTKELSAYKPGTEIAIMGPLGNGYKFDENRRHIILIGGGLGIPPLLFAAKSAGEQGYRTTALLGYRDETFMTDDFKAAAGTVHTITDNKGTVLDLAQGLMSVVSLDTSDALILSCGPAPMLKAVSEWAESLGIPTQISLEERMGCGYGACVGCTIGTKGGRKKVCKDGPVFSGDEVVW